MELRRPQGRHSRPIERNPETLARPWAVPGQKGLEHRIGGIEKSGATGNISYDPAQPPRDDHGPCARVARVAHDIPRWKSGPAEGDLLVLGWGGTYGAITTAAEQARNAGQECRLRPPALPQPIPGNLGEVLRNYKHVLIPELNNGQLSLLIRGKFLVDAVPFNKISGQPFKIAEIVAKIDRVLGLRGPYEIEFGHGENVSANLSGG